MCTIPGRSGKALLVIDVQVDVMAAAWRRDEVIGRIAGLVDSARAKKLPVVWVQHADEELVLESPGWEVVPELAPAADEPRVRKNFRSSFEATDLEDQLARLGVAELIVCGAETNHCVRFTVHDALERGYDVSFVLDGHTTWDGDYGNPAVTAAGIVAEQNSSFRHYELPGRACRGVLSAQAV